MMNNTDNITPEFLYNKRREFLKLGVGALVSVASIRELMAADTPSLQAEITPERLATNYVNFYEFSPDKKKAVEYAKSFHTRDWRLEVTGECDKPFSLSMQDILKFDIQQRTYFFRCVETWSMIVPWQGFELRALLDRAQPKQSAKFVVFTTLYDKQRFPDQAATFPTLRYPYIEALRLDEAMNPLTLLATGMYGKSLQAQNGAPIRLVVPWKYGFKSIKSIVKIEFVSEQPKTTWEAYAPNEYGFYANVNPQVSHPRWSQANERRLGEFATRPTLLFNGYEKQVAHLYEGMDLKTFF